MENYDDISKCSTTDLQMLTMVYMFDQGSANIKKIAEWLSTTEDLAEKALAEFKGTEAYDKYYALVSRYLNEYNGRQSSELLSRCSEEITGLLKTFNILSDREVSALTILNEGYAERMLKSDYCQKEFGKDLSGLIRNGDNGDKWKKLFSETVLLSGYRDSLDVMREYAKYQMNGKGKSFDEGKTRSVVGEQFAVYAQAEQNYRSVYQRNYACEDVQKLIEAHKAAVGQNDMKQLLKDVEKVAGDPIIIGKFIEYLYGVEHGLNKSVQPEHAQINDELFLALTKTKWFDTFVGVNIDKVNPQLMMPTQLNMAVDFAERVGKAEQYYLDQYQRLQPVVVNERKEQLLKACVEKLALQQEAENFVKGNSKGLDRLFFSSEQFLKNYGEGLEMTATAATPGDIMVMELYRKELELSKIQLGISLSTQPSEEKIGEYQAYLKNERLLKETDSKLDRLYAARKTTLREISASAADAAPVEKVVSLIYQADGGRFFLADAGCHVELPEDALFVDRYTTEKQAMDFVKMVDEKNGLQKSGKIDIHNIRQEFRIYDRLPENRKSDYLSSTVLSAENARSIENPDLEQMRKLEFEYKQKVDFDRANPGVADTIKTDENRAEYQAKVDKDSGKSTSAGMKIG
ncbi:hypothetical protein [Parabacteroides merdae]|uniref:hypothetical protein n=2 Tax=Parabacteroides merdae TaxID=46503 RepID=UPI0034A4FC88